MLKVASQRVATRRAMFTVKVGTSRDNGLGPERSAPRGSDPRRGAPRRAKREFVLCAKKSSLTGFDKSTNLSFLKQECER